MDGLPLELPIFIIATFAGAFVAGLSGFAFGLVAASLWLYILSPLQTATLIVAFGLIVQGYAVWKLRRAIDFNRLLPFLVRFGLLQWMQRKEYQLLSDGAVPVRLVV